MTNKLKLDLDALQVASFATQTPDADAQGTVAAHSDSIVILTITSSSLLTPMLPGVSD
ncbi:MAG TPA: hypothetical protein VF665_13765 [Longimicrobium sp.]|uniref:hypothetical protein n=1 Tax=Longimicrobium sp. TaxID=2029185 RepID=UPI002ED8E8C9